MLILNGSNSYQIFWLILLSKMSPKNFLKLSNLVTCSQPSQSFSLSPYSISLLPPSTFVPSIWTNEWKREWYILLRCLSSSSWTLFWLNFHWLSLPSMTFKIHFKQLCLLTLLLNLLTLSPAGLSSHNVKPLCCNYSAPSLRLDLTFTTRIHTPMKDLLIKQTNLKWISYLCRSSKFYIDSVITTTKALKKLPLHHNIYVTSINYNYS